MNILLLAALGAMIALFIGNILTYTLQFFVLFRPKALPSDYQFKFNHAFEEVTFLSREGGLIHSLWFKASSTPSSKGIILYFHGNRGNLTRWGHVYEQTFLKNHIDVFMIDYRSYGKSKGRISEHLFNEDALKAYEFLIKHYAHEKIIIYGRSIGSGIACELASKVRAGKLILETPFSSISDLFHTYYPFLPKLFVFKFRFNNYQHIKLITYPIVIIAGSKDRVTPLRCLNKIKLSLKDTDKLIIIKNGKHNNLNSFQEFHDSIKLELNF